MTIRVVRPEKDRVTEGITVAKAASILGCDHSTVRALIRNRALHGWHVGKTDKPGGVRCDLQSVRDYQARHDAGDDQKGAQGDARPRRKPRQSTAAYREAVAEAKALGIRLPTT